MKRMEWFADNHLINYSYQNILDVGSFNVNGCYREIFESRGHKYTGLDMESGPNVDIVPRKAYEWDEISDDTYDVVITGQALEHIEFFWVTISEIVRVTRRGGLICIIAPCGFEEHRYPVDCWRFFTDGMIALARYNSLEVIHAHTNSAPKTSNTEWYSKNCSDTMMIAQKKYNGRTKVVDLSKYICIPEDHDRINGGFKSFVEYKKELEVRELRQRDIIQKEEATQKTTRGKALKEYLRKIKRRINRYGG